MLTSSWARSPAPADIAVLLGGVVIAAIASIAAAPATTPNPACRPSMVHFMAEPKPLAKPIMQTNWPILERLAPPYAEEAEAPAPAVIHEAANSEPAPEPEDAAPRKHRRSHRHWR
ncbi:hypothetical protein ACNHKD_09620 [Methylocystis sp. JAN1]|uniref:hypothetical protein n=1 Tax=Methylocystis sp. JAN1 TaxID=3397211 RepID=UPI003FA33897